MSEVSKYLRNIFWRPIPPILQVEVGIFSGKKSFSQIFQNTANFFYLNFISVNFHKNQRNFFGRQGGRALITTRFARGWQGRGVVVRRTRLGCTRLGGHGFGTERARLVVQRLWYRTCKTSRSTALAQNVQGQSFNGFGTERARLVVQITKLRYAPTRLIGALRFARGFKKSACYLWGF